MDAITRETVAHATDAFLAAGGNITYLPDTVPEQKVHLDWLLRFEGSALADSDDE